MPRKKLERMVALPTLPNVLPRQTDAARDRLDERFGKGSFVTLELGCGQADLSRALADRFPQRKFVAVDIKGSRLWQAAQIASQLENLLFLRTQVEHIADYFAAGSVKEIWITFPDPYPKSRNSKRRLTAPENLRIYRSLLTPAGLLHFKTDDSKLLGYTEEAIQMVGGKILLRAANVHGEASKDELLAITTTYERQHLTDGRKIKYLRFTL